MKGDSQSSFFLQELLKELSQIQVSCIVTQVDIYSWAVLGLYIFAGQTWSNLDTLSRLRTIIGSFGFFDARWY